MGVKTWLWQFVDRGFLHLAAATIEVFSNLILVVVANKGSSFLQEVGATLADSAF
jgi:hypothetical protein